MNVLLVNLSLRHADGYGFAEIPLGLAYIQSAARRAGHRAEILDLQHAELQGASFINCGYAALLPGVIVPLDRPASSRTMTIRNPSFVRMKIERKVSGLLTSPACIAGVRVSLPNFRAR